MKRDCPHCNQAMGGRFVDWRKFASVDHSRVCRLCGKHIELRMYPEEIGVRILTILVVIGGGYWAKQRGGGYLMILVTVTAILVAAYLLVSFRLRDAQRFQKARKS